MVTTLTHGISSMIDNAEGAIVQSAEIEAKVEQNEVSGMVSGVTEIVKTFTHTHTNEFSVTGKGDLTVVPQTSATVSIAHFSSSFITGGKVTIRSFKYSQKIGETSDWSYSGRHAPYAS